jgi:hypothetical protein
MTLFTLLLHLETTYKNIKAGVRRMEVSGP